MKRLAVVLLLFAAPAFAADTPEPTKAGPPTVTLPKEVTGKAGAWIIVSAKTANAGPVRYYLPDPGLNEIPLNALFGEEWYAKAQGRVFTADQPGRYRVVAWAGGDNRDSSQGSVCTVIVGDAPPPVPPGPNPPGPNPPTPPGPTPGPAPIPADGLHVLIVYESADLNKLPKDQLNVLYSQSVLGYLNTHCAKGPDGKTPEWRIWDQNVPTGAEAKVWQDAMARKRDKLPWLIVSNGREGFEGPLPPNTDAMLRTLQTYGGK
jgi:hypothetical protein